MQPIRVTGLREVQKALKELDGQSQKELRLALNDAAQIIVNVAQRKVPTVTGAARASIRATSGQREARVSAGGRKAPYLPWLDYGGSTGRDRSVKRPFLRGGRYIYPAYEEQHTNVMRLLEKRITDLMDSKGIDVA